MSDDTIKLWLAVSELGNKLFDCILDGITQVSYKIWFKDPWMDWSLPLTRNRNRLFVSTYSVISGREVLI